MGRREVAITSEASPDDFEYDVCLTFAGEQRQYVEEVARELKRRQIRVFFDDFERADIWGKDLYEHLAYVYSRAARYCVLFASQDYAQKVWPSHERRNAQERALEAHGEYVLPARFDDTEIPGLRKTVKYEDLRKLDPAGLAGLIEEKIGPRQKTNFLPPDPDRLYEALELGDPEEREVALQKAQVFFMALQRMSQEERRVLYAFMGNSCPAELPENLHISEDLLRRITDLPPVEVRNILAGIHSLGFSCYTREPGGHSHENELEADDQMLVLEWRAMIAAPPLADASDLELALKMLHLAREPYCQFHAHEALMELNFTGLSTATFDPDGH
jgi:hypothetical protein